jgi:restriction endonuclease S subunit
LNSPFNEQRYKSLLEGLQISEVRFSEVVKDIFRLDSEPFQKINKVHLTKFETVKIPAIAFSNPVKSEISKLDGNLPVSFIPMTMLGSGIINEKEDGKISDFVKAGYTYFAENDILVAKITPCMEHGKCAIAKDLTNGIGFGSTEYNVFRIKDNRILTEYLFAYLNREFIRKQAENNMIGTSGRQRVPIAFYENLDIPIIDFEIQKKIKEKIDNSYAKREQSQSLYHQAEELLEEAVFGNEDCRDGARTVSMGTSNVNIKSLSASFLSTDRLDAEYYQPKYEEIENWVKGLQNGYGLLKDVCNLKDENYIPKESIAYQYIELADIGKSGNITGCTLSDGKELPSRARRKVNFGDVIISSIEGSLESCALVTDDYNNALCSTGFYVINSQAINSETLLVLFKSKPMQQLLKQNCSGTILTAINKSEFQNIPVPLIHKDIQNEIAALIQQSFALRRESERLLNEAKGMVEREIETSK